MKGVNKVIIIGTLGKDPEVRSTAAGSSVTNISVATSESWKSKETGNKEEKTEWHSVVFFGKLAEIAGQYLKKGSKVYIEGKLQTRKWQDQSGNDRYSTDIVVDGFNGQMQMLGDKPEGQQQGGQNQQQSGYQNQQNNNQTSQPRGSQPNQGGGQNNNYQAAGPDVGDCDKIPFWEYWICLMKN